MNGDYSRDTFDYRRHYSSVRLQQGRVVTDADWNEQADLTRYRAERQADDIIGHCGAPQDAAGFGLSAATYGLAVSAIAGSAWIAAEDGIVLRTTNDGASWTIHDSGSTTNLWAIRFVEANTGWAVGDRGTVVKTTDGGATWTAQPSGQNVALRGLAAVDATRAWAVGEDGTLLRTTDGGTTWTRSKLGSGRLYAVHFVNLNTGWIVGQNGQIFSTDDGGATWTSRPSGTTVPLRAVAFVSTSTGWATGDGGAILKTTDGAASWTAQASPVTRTLRATAFADANEGWAAGDAGTLLHTTDGGTTWQLEPIDSDVVLRGAASDAAGGAWIVGDRSSIIRTGGFSPGVGTLTLPGSSLSFSRGRLYVEGVLCENEERSSFYHQPDRQVATRLALGTHLVFVDVWQRHISHLQDPRIREVALGGPDTAARAKTVWQGRTLALPATSPADWNCLSSIPAWDALTSPATALLKARSEPEQAVSGVCEIPAAAGYRSVENQLYRVEVQEGSPAPTFKWSRENGSVSYGITSIVEDTAQNRTIVTLASRGPDENLDIAKGDWVEIIDDEAALEGGVGLLRRFIDEGDDRLEVVLEGTSGGEATGTNPALHPIIHRWEQRPSGTSPTLPIQEGQWIALEEGVEVWFEPGGSYRPGDYWQIPARTIIGDVEWPRDDHQEPLTVPPAGIGHRYCRLGLVEVQGDGTIEVISDCRELFPPLTAFTQLLYQSGDGQDGIPGQQLPQLLRVRVVRGEHPVVNATVRFEVQTGLGTLVGAAPGSPLEVLTQTDGAAECGWILDANPSASARFQRVAAMLLDAAGDDVPGQRVIFCATATVTLQYVSGDGQQAPAGQPLTHPLEVRACNGQRPVPGAAVHFAVTQGGGALLDPTPAMTSPSGVATMRWRLGSSGAQRVEAELRDGGARVQHVGFNADIEAPATAGPGGCSITIGERGEIKQLTSEAIKELLLQFEGRLCLCFLAGDHVIEGLTVEGADSARVSIHGCGPAAVIKLNGRNNIVGFEYFELSGVAINAEKQAGFTFDTCSEVVVRNLTVSGADAGEQPLLYFTAFTAVTVEGCSIRTSGRTVRRRGRRQGRPGLSVIIDSPSGSTRLANNDIQGITSFYGMPLFDENLPPADGVLKRMREGDFTLQAEMGEVMLANNRFGLLTLGEEMMFQLNEFAQGRVQNITGLFRSATLSGNSIADPRSIFMSAMLTVGTTSILADTPELASTFVAEIAAVTGTVTIRPNMYIVAATRQNQCDEAGNMPDVRHN
jgi:photosystem II stability/assembly factor-like uncharacterized protein